AFFNGFTDNFFQAGDAFAGQRHAELAQGDHATPLGFGADVVGRGVAHHHVADGVVEDHQLKQANASLVPRVVAGVAARAAVKLFAFQLAAFHAEFKQQVG